MRKYILLSLLLSVCVSVHSQNEFADIKNEVNRWYSEITSASTLSSKTSNYIEYPSQQYLIDGVVSKGILCEGTIVKFYDISSLTPNLLLEGIVSYQYNRLVVEGIRHDKTLTGTNNIYGSFYVYNMDDYSMNYKPKKAGPLRIKCYKALYLEGLYFQSPVLVRLNDKNSSIYIDGKIGGKKYSLLSAEIPNNILNDDDTFDVVKIILQIGDNATLYDDEGMVFKGRIRPIPQGGDSIQFQLMEGEKTGIPFGPKKQKVNRQHGEIIYTQENNEDNSLLSIETMYVKDDGTMSDLWNIRKYYEHCFLAKWTYRNGNYFEGSIKSIVTTDRISSTATKGIFKYSNGDRFEGDLSTKTVGPFFVDGTTMLVDGTKLKGNWLEKYKLSNSQLTKIYNCKNPSEAIALAKQFTIENDEQAKEERYNSLVNSVKALGETPYQKALISWRDRYYKQLETECWVSGTTILGGFMIEGLGDLPTNAVTLGYSMAAITLEALSKRPMVFKSITEKMALEMKQIVKLALPIEIELEKLLSEKLNSRNSTPSKLKSEKLKPIVQESNDSILKAKEKVIEKEKTENKVFDEVEQMPSFPGGPSALFEYLAKNIKYPKHAKENGVQGRVICTLVVERDGSISDVKVVKSVDPSLDKEAVRVLREMPKWKPGMQEGIPVRVKYTCPVTFRLQ